MKIAMIFDRYLDLNGEQLTIGGVQTYLGALSALFDNHGWDPLIIQRAVKPFCHNVGPARVIGVEMGSPAPRRVPILLYQAALRQIDPQMDMIIFAADQFSVKCSNSRAISIQHGVSWDMPIEHMTQRALLKHGMGGSLRKWMQCRKALRYFANCRNTVCVDYNFYNWYRTNRTLSEDERVWIIPNFAPTADEQSVARKLCEPRQYIHILFARRFKVFRGTRLFAHAALRILDKFSNVKITFAGEGDDEDFLRKMFADHERVSFTRYVPGDVLDILRGHDVAVVPSLASEGTCLAVAEAMGSGLAVVATCVGGITNMIISEYNGLLVQPNGNALFDAMERLVVQPDLLNRIGMNALRTASCAFTKDRWHDGWLAVINEVMAGDGKAQQENTR